MRSSANSFLPIQGRTTALTVITFTTQKTVMAIDEEDVREKLKEVIDPELEINIVDLGLVYEIEVEDDEIYVLMTLTSRACPLHGVFDELLKKELRDLDPEDIEIELTFDPQWTPEKMTDEARNELGHVPGMQGF